MLWFWGLAVSVLLGVPVGVGAQTSMPNPATPRSVRRLPISGAPTGVTAFVNVNVIPMDTNRVLLNQTVLVKNGRIVALGSNSKVQVPAGATRIEGQSKYLIPGLNDMHAHAVITGSMTVGPSARVDSIAVEQRLFRWLGSGITTARIMDYQGNTEANERTLRFRARAAAGTLWSPQIYTAGPLVPVETKDDGPPPAAMAQFVAAYRAKGYDFIKLRNQRSTEQVDSIVAAARRLGLPITGHAPKVSPEGNELERAFALGYRSIEHLTGYYQYLYRKHVQPALPKTNQDDPISDSAFTVAVRQQLDAAQSTIAAVAAATKQAGVWNTPTLAYFAKNANEDVLLIVSRLTVGLHTAGAGLLLGTDAIGGHRITAQDELKALVAAGLTPYQALVTGTRNPAVYFGTLAETGTIAVGKRADLLLLAGNPLADIKHTEQLMGVMIGGRWLSRAAIDQQLAVIAAEPYTRPITTAEQILPSLRLTPEQSRSLKQRFDSAHQVQRQRLLDSLRTNPDPFGYTRVLVLVGRQLGELRTALTPEFYASFDSAARVWVALWEKEGSSPVIPGVGK